MTADRCPYCKAVVTATTTAGSSTLVVDPCGHENPSESLLIEPGDRLPPRPDEWLQYAHEKAVERDFENVSFDHGSFREPNVDEPVDVVVVRRSVSDSLLAQTTEESQRH